MFRHDAGYMTLREMARIRCMKWRLYKVSMRRKLEYHGVQSLSILRLRLDIRLNLSIIWLHWV